MLRALARLSSFPRGHSRSASVKAFRVTFDAFGDPKTALKSVPCRHMCGCFTTLSHTHAEGRSMTLRPMQARTAPVQ